MKSKQNCDPDAKKQSAAKLNFFILSKMKNVAKIEIVLHDPYSNALWAQSKSPIKIPLEMEVAPRYNC